MKQLKKEIKVTTTLPYYINTGMFDGVQSCIPILEAEATALTIIKAIEKNKKIITIPGWIYRFTRFGQAFMSVDVFHWFAGNIMGIYKSILHKTTWLEPNIKYTPFSEFKMRILKFILE